MFNSSTQPPLEPPEPDHRCMMSPYTLPIFPHNPFSRDAQLSLHPRSSAPFQDVLRTRVRTTGIVRIEFEFGRKTFHMFDVGGQRSERKKWIHCFDNVTAVLFVISLSEFDQVLAEDGRTNRMRESLRLFSSVANSVYFRLMPLIVFFNKRDLFQDKLDSMGPAGVAAGVRRAFPDYAGDGTFEDATDFIINRYRRVLSHLFFNQTQI